MKKINCLNSVLIVFIVSLGAALGFGCNQSKHEALKLYKSWNDSTAEYLKK